MPLIWVTGNSGTGKSSVSELLSARGHVAIDADDDGISRWFDRVTGAAVDDPPYPVPPGWLDRYGWAADRSRIEQLAIRPGMTFLCGSVENEAEVRDLFDAIVCLVVDDETLRQRLASRDSNAFGRNREELAAALDWNPRMRPLYEQLGATIIDATQPLTAVVDAVLAASLDR